MAIIPSSKYPAQTVSGDPGYPHGAAQNIATAGDGTGTPLEKDWLNDLWGFLQALLDSAGITPSGDPDEVGASDYLDALNTRIGTTSNLIVLTNHLPETFYSGRLVDINSEENNVTGLFFKPDGTKMFICGTGSDSIHQYSLSEPWRIDSATFDSVSFSVVAEASNPNDVLFNADGTKFYVMPSGTSVAHQFSTGSAWSLSGSSYDSVSFDFTSQNGSMVAFCFNNDGTKLIAAGLSGGATLYQYTLSTPFILDPGMSYDSVSLSIDAQGSAPTGIRFSPTGDRIFTIDSTSDAVFEYALPVPYTLSGGTYSGASFSVPTALPNGLFFSQHGGRLYVADATENSVREYYCSLVLAA